MIVVLTMRIGLIFTGGRRNVEPFSPSMVAAMTGLVLVVAMLARRVWQPQILGQGAEEFRRLRTAVIGAAMVAELTTLVMDFGRLRSCIFVLLLCTGVALAFSRCILRRVLRACRRNGSCMLSALAAGSLDEVADLITRTRRESQWGWRVEAVCVPGGVSTDRRASDGRAVVNGVPVVGDLDEVAGIARRGNFRAIIVAPDPHWSRCRVRELGWQLEGAAVELMVAPGLMEVSEPRLHVTSAYGLTLLRISQPVFSGVRWVLKTVLDRVVAVLALILLIPLMFSIGIAIKREDNGPVLFRQARVGKGGRIFPMVKFRSMVIGAEARLAELKSADEGAGPLFKIHNDPRVTRVGSFLRRFSLDELPQLINVVRGHMSLVGPRPPLPSEVAKFGFDAKRRLLVKPGLTGLWQISGRSDLSWEESVQLDLRYVENWSFALDAMILSKTLGAVLRGRGAY